MDQYNNIRFEMRKADLLRKDLEKENKRRYKDDSKQKLKANAEKKLKTSLIGSLDSYEKNFGHLWGHGRDVRDLTQSEKLWRDLWEKVRKEILDRGNNQLRALKSEIDEYEIEWNRYQMNLPVLQTFTDRTV